MNVSTFIARRYFFAKSTRNAVNIISGISILGILVGTLALIVVLSAFNGLENLVTGFYDTFDPDLKITPKTGKFFDENPAQISELRNTEGVREVSKILEERVLLTFNDKEYIATLKGVDENYREVTRIGEAITHGEYFSGPTRDAVATSQTAPRAVLGAGVNYFLGYSRIDFENPINVFVPKIEASASDFADAFSSELLYPSGIFSVQPEFDEKYVLASMDYVSKLLNRPDQLSSIELKINDFASVNSVKKSLKKIVGDNFEIKDRQEQQAVFLKVMKSESLFTFLVFALILGIASFTIMGSLSMMMLDKKEHLRTLWAVGTDIETLRRIFFKEGLIISAVGAVFGLLLGIGIVLLQQHFGIISLGQGYVVDSYPMVLKIKDVLLVFGTVAVLCGSVSWLTSRRLGERLVRLN